MQRLSRVMVLSKQLTGCHYQNRRRSRRVNKAELFQKISALATECHAIASELDVGDERTEMFEIYSVLRNLCRRGYATQVGRMTNPLLSSCDEDDSDEDDE